MAKQGKKYVADFENNVPKSDIYDKKGRLNDDALSELIYSSSLPEEKLDDEFYLLSLMDDDDYNETRVWASAICSIKMDPETSDVILDDSIDEFLRSVSNLENNSMVYFHNLSYDGMLLSDALLKMGYSESKCGRDLTADEIFQLGLEGEELEKELKKLRYKKTLEPKSFQSVITGDGIWYELKVKFSNRHTIIFRDSLKLLPFSVDKIAKDLKTKAQKLKGSIDYTIKRTRDWVITDTERRYIENDVLVMSEALAKVDEEFNLLDHLTIASACMSFYKTKGGKLSKKEGNKKFRETFPVIDKQNTFYVYETDDFTTPFSFPFDTEGQGNFIEVRANGEAIKFDYSKKIVTFSLDKGNYIINVRNRVDRELRKSYRGGWCYVNPTYENKVLDNVDGYVYDVNSLYPSVMYSKGSEHTYPIGKPKYFKGSEFNKYKRYPYIIKLRGWFMIKPNHLPFIQIKGCNRGWSDNEYLTDSGEEPIELTLTRPDYELFCEQYDSSGMEIIEGWYFSGNHYIFNDYVSFWYDIKKRSKAEGNFVMTLLAKLHLNSLYGKFGMAVEQSIGHLTIVDDKVKITREREMSDGVYVPVASFCTSYARGVTIRAAQKNINNFCYSDTDSIHLLAPSVDIPVGKELGDWDNETGFTKARFVRQKTYIEYTTVEDGKPCNPYLNIKACGAPELVKTRLLYKVSEIKDDQPVFYPLEYDEEEHIISEERPVDEVINRFTYGLVEAGKMMKKRVAGGSILVETTFNIRKPKGSD